MKPAAEFQRASFKVWDPVVRAGHWALVASVALAWWTYQGGGAWHERIGYLSLGLVVLRVVWGIVGPGYARFSQFIRSPLASFRYARAAIAGHEARYVGHNPLGGWMIVALLVTILLTDMSGWLYTTHEFWGDERVADAHFAAALFLVLLVVMHVAGVIVASRRHRENLIAAMLHGRKRPPADGDIG